MHAAVAQLSLAPTLPFVHVQTRTDAAAADGSLMDVITGVLLPELDPPPFSSSGTA